MRTRHTLLGLALSIALTQCAPEGDTFIAFASDFQSYRSWTRFELGERDTLGHSVGPRTVYINRLPPPGSSEFPVGTILIKGMESNADPQYWELFGMAKRGGGFNSAGLRGWEFFLLKVDPVSGLVIEGRGIDPQGGDGYGGFGSSGAGCNSCHGTSAALARDGLLSEAVFNGTLSANGR